MGKRSTARKLAMQALYQKDISGTGIDESIRDITEREQYLQDTITFARKLANGAWEGRAPADAVIKKFSKNWSMERMGNVVVSILRLALYEISSGQDTPVSVVMNEAVELSKKFAGDDAAKFVNGILASYLKEIK